jgi:hypothetical protein
MGAGASQKRSNPCKDFDRIKYGKRLVDYCKAFQVGKTVCLYIPRLKSLTRDYKAQQGSEILSFPC